MSFTPDELAVIALRAAGDHLADPELPWLLWEDWPALTEEEFAFVRARVNRLGEIHRAGFPKPRWTLSRERGKHDRATRPARRP